jgi:Ca-activated chloride channel family protein
MTVLPTTLEELDMNGSHGCVSATARARACVRASVVTCALAMLAAGCTDKRTAVAPAADESAGGTGARAKGDEGSMGNPSTKAGDAPTEADLDSKAPANVGLLGHGGGAGSAPPAPRPSRAQMQPGAKDLGIVGRLPTVSASAAATVTAAPPPPGLFGDDLAVTAPAPRLDPNARYATTYRPGGAALAAFDAAVSRGQIPSTYKDLVGEFGSRYAPAIARPASGALAVSIDTERAAVSPVGGPMNLRVSLVSSEAMATRAPLSVHIVLDTSGSMSGQAIDDARKAAEAVVSRLAFDDDFSMVTFSDTAHLLVADGPIGPRRAQIVSRIEGVQADGGTNISAGLDEGYAEAHDAHIAADAVRIVMLLSDGHANGGDTSPQNLAGRAARAFQDGIQTSSFGLGPDFDAALMSRIADRGAGGYYYLADTSQIAPALAREIDARLQPVATAVELRVRLRPDVSASKVFGSRELTAIEAAGVRAQEVAVDQQESKNGIARDRKNDAEGGMRFFIPAFARADRHATMITLELPPGTGERNVASVEVRYKDRLLGKNVTQEVPVHMRWAESDAASAQTENASVERMAQAFAAGETILAAAERVDAGDRAGARRLLDERVDVLQRAADSLHEPMLAEDGGRLARLASAVGGGPGAGAVGDPLPLVVMLRGSGYGYL